MDIAMGILGTGTKAVAEEVIQPEAEPQPPPSTMSQGTATILEKLQAGKEILKMMEDQQKQNLEYARMFAELAKSVQWPTGTTP